MNLSATLIILVALAIRTSAFPLVARGDDGVAGPFGSGNAQANLSGNANHKLDETGNAVAVQGAVGGWGGDSPDSSDTNEAHGHSRGGGGIGGGNGIAIGDNGGDGGNGGAAGKNANLGGPRRLYGFW